jgi:hypothetical protein
MKKKNIKKIKRKRGFVGVKSIKREREKKEK